MKFTNGEIGVYDDDKMYKIRIIGDFVHLCNKNYKEASYYSVEYSEGIMGWRKATIVEKNAFRKGATSIKGLKQELEYEIYF